MTHTFDQRVLAYASVFHSSVVDTPTYTFLSKTHFLLMHITLEEALERIDRDLITINDLRHAAYRQLEIRRYVYTIERNRIILDGADPNSHVDPETHPRMHSRLTRVRTMKAMIAQVTKHQMAVHKEWLSATTWRNKLLHNMAVQVGDDGIDELIEWVEPEGAGPSGT